MKTSQKQFVRKQLQNENVKRSNYELNLLL